GSQVPTDATERRVVTGGGTPDPVPDDAPRLDGRRRAPRERLLVVGGPDVHFRIGLMHALSSRYEVAAAGSEPSLADQFERESFPYHCFRLARGVNPADDLRTVSELEALIRDVRPTIVHT